MEYEGKEINKGMSNLDLALRYLKTDKVSVMPVGKDKKPLVSWKAYQAKLPTQKQVKDWWGEYPEAQIGIITGKVSNLTVIDVEAGGDWSYLPQDTLIVKTGGGGRHYYFQYCEGVQNKVRIKDLTDVRSEGGYVVAPGSISDKGAYEIVNLARPIPFPKDLFDFSSKTPSFLSVKPPTRAEVPKVKKVAPTKEELSKTGGKVNIFDFLLDSSDEELVSLYPGFPHGQRNQAMAQFIGVVLKRLQPSEWDSRGMAIISDANEKNTPALSDYELGSIFRSIKNREIIQISQNAGLAGQIQIPVNLPPTTINPETGEEEDAVKHISVVAKEQQVDQTDVYPLQMKCFDDAILGGPCSGDLLIVAGKTGEGKSSLAMDWTISFIRGEKKAKVLWFSYELLPTHLWKKFENMGMTEEDIAVIPAKHTSGNVAWVEKKVKEAKEKFGVKIVVIDHLGFLLPKIQNVFGKNMSSNYATFLTQITREIKKIAIDEEVVIILPVHMRKTDKVDMDAIKDSAGISQESDLVFLIERERDKKKNAKSYYTEFTKITLSKNRKTGTTVVGWFKMFNDRFAYDLEKNKLEDERRDDEARADKEFDEIDKPSTVASSPVNKFGYQPKAYEDSTDKATEKVEEKRAEIKPTAEEDIMSSVFK